LLVWAHYNANSYHVSTIIDGSSYSIFPYSWALGRVYSSNTRFYVYDTNGGAFQAVVYPDPSSGETGDWHYYGVTWDGTNFVGYFDGSAISTNSQTGFPALVLGGKASAHWIAVGCLTHNGSPQIDGDNYPNNGFFGGEIDDIRIYNRALSGAEVQSLYNRMHKF
jgi:Concanavalin A-like lectin/glucanases superfamily